MVSPLQPDFPGIAGQVSQSKHSCESGVDWSRFSVGSQEDYGQNARSPSRYGSRTLQFPALPALRSSLPERDEYDHS